MEISTLVESVVDAERALYYHKKTMSAILDKELGLCIELGDEEMEKRFCLSRQKNS